MNPTPQPTTTTTVGPCPETNICPNSSEMSAVSVFVVVAVVLVILAILTSKKKGN